MPVFIKSSNMDYFNNSCKFSVITDESKSKCKWIDRTDVEGAS
jgi:hypothetical protein